MDRPGLSPQRCFHPRSILSLLRGKQEARPTGLCGHWWSAERRSRASGRLSMEAGRHAGFPSKPIYRALGVENIRHRRKANRSVVMRRLLSLDFVLEHPGMNWLPTEGEKVEFIEGLGVHSNLIPRRIYYGAVRAQKRYFALKLPVAGGDKTVTFAYVDPGRETTVRTELMGSGAWTALGCDPRQGAAGGSDRHRRGTGYGFAGGSSATALGGGGAWKGGRGVDGEAGDQRD